MIRVPLFLHPAHRRARSPPLALVGQEQMIWLAPYADAALTNLSPQQSNPEDPDWNLDFGEVGVEVVVLYPYQ